MMTTKSSAGITLKGKSKESIACNAWGGACRLRNAVKHARDGILPNFETPGWRQLKYKLVVSVSPKRTNVLQNSSEQNVIKFMISIITQFFSVWTNPRVTHTLLLAQPITIVYNCPLKPLKSVYQENTLVPIWTHRHVGEAFPSVNFRFLHDYYFYWRFI